MKKPDYRALLLGTTLLLAAGPASGQQTPTVDTVQITLDEAAGSERAVLGARRGLEAARYESTTGWLWGGFLGGATLGPIGAGFAWALANNSDVALGVDRRVLLSYDGGVTYVDAFERAFAEELLRRRKRSALTGGALGTAALAATLTAIWAVYYFY